MLQLVSLLAYTRWDPRSRAGAVAVTRSSPHDLKAVEALSDSVADWARYQNLSGDSDTVEKCPVAGIYDWRAYIQEETQLAQRREERAKPRDKKAERAEPGPVPPGYYA